MKFGNKPKRKKKAGFLATALAAIIGFSASSVGVTMRQLPDSMTVYADGKSTLETLLPVEMDCDLNSADARIFGLIKVKEVSVSVSQPKKVLLCGTLFGVKLYSDGVMVVGFSDFTSDKGVVNPAKDARLEEGDVIKSVDGVRVYTNSEFSKYVKSSAGKLTLEVESADGRTKTVDIYPQYSVTDKCLKTGMWIRDSAAGIGTMTYIDAENGSFGGLGHGIYDVDTDEVVPVHGGEIVNAKVSSIKRGVKGAAGEIQGYLGSEKLGEITENTICGMFGTYSAELPEGDEYEVALKQEIKTGKAQMLCSVDGGEPRFYDISIVKINYSGSEPAQNMVIKVTDKELLEKTGGIIQGMSGSPIVQNGKFIGAVTHVFVNDPTRGYAIFSENMIF